MNIHEHAESSAKIFGGNSKDYLPIHEIIDGNKLVSASIFCRFFMHHYDVGNFLLNRAFGKILTTSNILVEHVLIQHLLEDYGQIVNFENDWCPSFSKFKIKNLENLVFVKDTELRDRISKDKRVSILTETEIKRLKDIFLLKDFLVFAKSRFDLFPENLGSSALIITCHTSGIHLLAKIIGEKIFDKYWTLDVLTGYLNCALSVHSKIDNIPTLIDWVDFLELKDMEFMHAPKEKINITKGKIKKIHTSLHFQKVLDSFNKQAKSRTSYIAERQPCNYD